jgi:DNA-binding beta-propeller fold protein YncE
MFAKEPVAGVGACSDTFRIMAQRMRTRITMLAVGSVAFPVLSLLPPPFHEFAERAQAWAPASLQVRPGDAACQPGACDAQAETHEQWVIAPLSEVRFLETDKLGIAEPEGMAYVPGANVFLLLAKVAGGDVDAGLTVFTVSPFNELIAAGGLDISTASPINMTFDGEDSQLLLLVPAHGPLKRVFHELIRIGVSDGGVADTSMVERTDVRSLELRDPRGMAVDPATGRLLILDAGTGQIVTVDRNESWKTDGAAERRQFADALHWSQTGQLSLFLPNVGGLRGLAVNPVNSHIFVMNPAVQLIYELSPAGELLASYSLPTNVGTFPDGLQGMAFAPTADLTDDPARLHLYVNDGCIRELSFEPALPSVSLAKAMDSVTSTPVPLIRNMDTSSYPAPDPAGLAFLSTSNHLLISDSEVDEMAIFTSRNVYETDLAGALLSSSVTTAFSREPTGLALNPANGHLFISDDDQGRVYEVNPGGDGLYNTSDDAVTWFDTHSFHSHDPEGVAYHAVLGHLLIADGVNSEVYQVDPGPNRRFDGIDDIVTSFDTQALGITDPEGIEVHPTTGNVYIIGSPARSLAEISPVGLLLRVIDISAAQPIAPAGLACGRSSVNPAVISIYIADRGVDNNDDPDENDGRVYEMSLPVSAPGNRAPVVDAGPDQQVSLCTVAHLAGSVSDDGLPNPPGAVTVVWDAVSGPAAVTFRDAHAAATTASFVMVGDYRLRLMATDGALTASDVMTVHVKRCTSYLPAISR